LPSGKTGRFAYFESQPAELNARLGDFVKMTGTLALCEGRLPVIFDILAPNYRTVQKTKDLSSFWANTYPTVKKELQRRYPRHPWP
jgi:ATP-dependent helicase HrpB